MKWPVVPLGDIALSVRNGIFARRPTDTPVGSRILRISAVRDGRVNLGDSKWVTGLDQSQLERFSLNEDDLLLTRYNGSRSLVGISGIVPRLDRTTVHPDKLIRVVIDRRKAEPRFVNYQLNSPLVRAHIEPRIRTTAGQSGISGIDVKSAPIVLPPLDEQRRIIELLDDHLSRLDAAAADLDNADRGIRALEMSVMATANEGDEFSLAEVTEIQGGIQKQPKRTPIKNCYPFLRVANVGANGLDLSDVHQIELFDGELDRLRLQRGDLLVVEGNGSPSQIGRAALWDGSIRNAVHQNHLIRLRPVAGLLPAYLEAVWNSPKNRALLTDVSSSSSGLHTLSVSKLKRIRIRVPGIERQAQMVAAIEGVRASNARIAQSIVYARRKRQALRKALLSAAFCGQLTDRSSTELVSP